MLPNVVAEHRLVSLHQRTVLVRRADDFELAAFEGEPNPTAAKASKTSGFKFFFEPVEAADSSIDIVGQFTRRLAARILAHDAPEHRVIGVTTAVVPHCSSDVFRHSVQ